MLITGIAVIETPRELLGFCAPSSTPCKGLQPLLPLWHPAVVALRMMELEQMTFPVSSDPITPVA